MVVDSTENPLYHHFGLFTRYTYKCNKCMKLDIDEIVEYMLEIPAHMPDLLENYYGVEENIARNCNNPGCGSLLCSCAVELLSIPQSPIIYFIYTERNIENSGPPPIITLGMSFFPLPPSPPPLILICIGNITENYHLTSIVRHIGKSLKSGHYIAQIKTNGWELLNDSVNQAVWSKFM